MRESGRLGIKRLLRFLVRYSGHRACHRHVILGETWRGGGHGRCRDQKAGAVFVSCMWRWRSHGELTQVYNGHGLELNRTQTWQASWGLVALGLKGCSVEGDDCPMSQPCSLPAVVGELQPRSVIGRPVGIDQASDHKHAQNVVLFAAAGEGEQLMRKYRPG